MSLKPPVRQGRQSIGGHSQGGKVRGHCWTSYVWTNSRWNLGRFQCVSQSASEWSWQEDLLDFWWHQRDYSFVSANFGAGAAFQCCSATRQPAGPWLHGMSIIPFQLFSSIFKPPSGIDTAGKIIIILIMKKRSERRKHCALAVVRRTQKLRPAADPLSRVAGRPKFNQLEMVTTFTNKSNLVRIDARNFELSW